MVLRPLSCRTDDEGVITFLRRLVCRHLFVDYYGRFEGESFCIDCGKRKVFKEDAL